ncbi:NAD-dependent dehydratase [Klebsiella sp. WP7-S18-CRE-02]|uniref:NAD(P)H-binding protein n=1 Tax=Enterobacteriaceae TaxID=543 RepID=UPI0015DC2269|nr:MULTISPECIES: NAD(P)H-binding protein [unclassified Klebsiella]BBR59199.1 NAD-dependent dehydratase [Klebsiella sp. WP4-W18-ESBL-05]BBS91448.1 NAD-dependent dehydratase [Klebsiella sp. WP7-S18-CRE-02]BBS96470.1 NAD-dependent dehydratase [Klebsiella sp. WP7-S18-CRE-03]BBT01502.1 NAD-dependent dehydratase [Klebsiella sp. WP7-S18-ESBL-04]BBT71194.1 NAD-dependent dehydratase [Klebsiella sp. WP8-S18-ESBL-06]
MTNVLILGAAGSLARVVTRYLLDNSQAQLTLYLRNSARLQNPDTARVTLIEGDVLNDEQLRLAMRGKDIVYANLSGNMKEQAATIIRAMKSTGVRRLIFISSMGIYDEVPGEKYGSILAPYRESAKIIENAGLDHTIIRPAWFTNGHEVEYGLTHRNEPFRGSSVSRLSIADLINRMVIEPSLYVHDSLGIARV